MEYDVFFSYPHKDASKVDKILKALQAQGLNVWIDKIEILDFESITKSIIEGLARSKVLLAYYSLNYWRSRACQWELNATFLAAQSEGDPRKRVLIINPEEKAEHIHPVELRDELFLTNFKDDESLVNLASKVNKHIQEITNVIGEVHALIQPLWYGKKGVGSNRFVGRLQDMWKIHSALHASESPVITGSSASPVVQVQGMGGVGKSLLAEEYALRYAAAFPGGVFWLRAFGSTDIKATMKPEELETECIRQIVEIATAYGIPIKDRSPEEIEAHLVRELGRNGKPFLWVVDDIPPGLRVETLLRWIASHPLGKTLITTRSKEYSALGKLVPLGVLEPEEAWDLLTLWRKPEKKEENTAARMLIDDLGCHALAVDVAGASLRASEGFQSFSEFREELASPTSDELELATELIAMLPTGHGKSITSTLFRSIGHLGEEGRDFLRLASILAAVPIPASLISAVFSEVDNLDEQSGKRRAILATSQVDMSSLAERAEDEPGARSVHVLISRTVRFKDFLPERSGMLHAAAVRALITKLSIIADGQVHNELRLVVFHARALVSSKENLLIADLMGWVARYYYLHGDYESAETLFRRKWNIQNLFLDDEHPSKLSTMNSLANTLRSQGAYSGARKLQEQVLEIQRKILGDEHPNTLSTMINLATTLSEIGDYAPARKLNEQVLEIWQEVLGDENPLTLTAMSNLADVLKDQGNYAGARKLHEKILGIRRKVLGNEHPDTLTTMNNLSEVLRLQDDYAGARKLIEHVVEIWQKELGNEHPNTLISISNLALILSYQCDYAGARKLDEQILKIQLKVLGNEHPSTLTTMNNLANTLYEQGKYAGARELQEQVLEIQRKILGDEHPNTLSTMNNLAETLCHQCDYADARKLHEQVLEILGKVLGNEHPHTLSTMNNLACTLNDMGDYTGARKLHEQVWEIQRKVLGDEHLETLSTMNNLANVLDDLGDYIRARELHEKVLGIRRKILGDEHPDTLTTMSNLADTLDKLDDHTEAIKLNGYVLEIRRKVLGDEHLDTLRAMSNLANTYYGQGKYAKARKLQEQVFEIQRKILGDEHLSTLIVMSNLANTLYCQGEYTSARKLNEQALEIQMKVLGDEHPDTLTNMNNLAEMLNRQGDYAGAKKLHERILEVRQKVLGDEHLYTSMSAWNLFATLIKMEEPETAINILKKNLLWLIDSDLMHITEEQQKIREMIIQLTSSDEH